MRVWGLVLGLSGIARKGKVCLLGLLAASGACPRSGCRWPAYSPHPRVRARTYGESSGDTTMMKRWHGGMSRETNKASRYHGGMSMSMSMSMVRACVAGCRWCVRAWRACWAAHVRLDPGHPLPGHPLDVVVR